MASIGFAHRFRIRWLTLADMSAPAVALAHATGRQGCQLSGDGDWGDAIQIAIRHGLPESYCRMECGDGGGGRQARQPDLGLLSARPRASHADLRERALHRGLSRTEADAEADAGRGTRLLHLLDISRSEPLSDRNPSDRTTDALGAQRSIIVPVPARQDIIHGVTFGESSATIGMYLGQRTSEAS
jgi:hypothetical protein